MVTLPYLRQCFPQVMIVLFLTGMVGVIIVRVLRRDISNYNQLESGEDAQEETGWKLVGAARDCKCHGQEMADKTKLQQTDQAGRSGLVTGVVAHQSRSRIRECKHVSSYVLRRGASSSILDAHALYCWILQRGVAEWGCFQLPAPDMWQQLRFTVLPLFSPQVHGDVFRPPPAASLLATFVGTGVQLFGMALVTMVFALLGFLSPANRGGLMTAMLMMFVFMGLFAGYFSARLYKSFRGEEWKRTTLRTALLFPGEQQ
jgi:positive regulator of sigma E activity